MVNFRFRLDLGKVFRAVRRVSSGLNVQGSCRTSFTGGFQEEAVESDDVGIAFLFSCRELDQMILEVLSNLLIL